MSDFNKEIVLVNTKNINIYAFVGNSDKNELLEDAKKYYKNDELVFMEFESFLNFQKEQLMKNATITEVTKENYTDALNVLPPIKYCTIDGVTMFCMCEMYTGSFTTQYAKVGDKYFTKLVDITDKETWIHKNLIR